MLQATDMLTTPTRSNPTDRARAILAARSLQAFG